jgi:hypothetical protein
MPDAEPRERVFIHTKAIAPVLVKEELARPFEMEFVLGGVLPMMVLSVPEITPLIEAQFRSKLRMGLWREGLLLNFSAPTLRDGLRRIGTGPQSFEEREAAMRDQASTDSLNSFAPS